jgi:hypothetical protein
LAKAADVERVTIARPIRIFFILSSLTKNYGNVAKLHRSDFVSNTPK